MKSRWSIGALVAATALSGFLAGGNVVRMFIEMPAWRKTGVVAWAAFSRHADLENGLAIYPTLAIGGALATIAAAIAMWRDRDSSRAARLPISVAVVLVVAGLVLTRFAAPQMLSLRTIGDDPIALQKAFDAFDAWGNLRGVAQILAFGADLWALAVVARRASFSRGGI
jgi:hypothetical protein